MDRSPFAKLAPELRNQIYELVLYNPQGFVFTYRNGRYDKNELVDIRKPNRKPNTFTHPMKFYRFGTKMSKEQTRRYGLRLKHGRKWLKSIGPANSAAISHYEIDLGRWELRRTARVGSRQWRTMARRLERKQLLPRLRQSAIFVSMTLILDRERLRFTHSIRLPCLVGEGTRDRECFSVRFTIPEDQKEAGEAIERTYREKLRQMEGHVDHQDCRVTEWLPTIRVGLRKCRKAMMHAVGIKEEEVEGATDAVGGQQIG